MVYNIEIDVCLEMNDHQFGVDRVSRYILPGLATYVRYRPLE